MIITYYAAKTAVMMNSMVLPDSIQLRYALSSNENSIQSNFQPHN